MNGYVGIQFQPQGKEYYYMIPNYIGINDIKNYVVVPDRFANENCAPYRVVWVKGVYTKKPAGRVDTYIVDTVDSDLYHKYDMVSRCNRWVTEKFNNLTLDEKVQLLANANFFSEKDADILIRFFSTNDEA